MKAKLLSLYKTISDLLTLVKNASLVKKSSVKWHADIASLEQQLADINSNLQAASDDEQFTLIQKSLHSIQKELENIHSAISNKPVNTPVINNSTQPRSNPTIQLNRHEVFLQHDINLITKMRPLANQLVNLSTQDDPTALLKALGNLSFEIKHDENDPLCIRNVLSDSSDEKGKSREIRIKPSGIPLQSLFYIGKWIEKEADELNLIDLQNWIIKHKEEFISLNNKLNSPPEKLVDEVVLVNIKQFGDFACDILHLEILIKNLIDLDTNKIDLEDTVLRYALARIYAIIGETMKSLSHSFVDHPQLKLMMHELAKCRDLVKLPYIMPISSKRMKEAHQFLSTHSAVLIKFYGQIKSNLMMSCQDGLLTFIHDYPAIIKKLIDDNLSYLNIDTIQIDVMKIRSTYDVAKRAEKTTAKKIDNSANETVPDKTMEDQWKNAILLIEGNKTLANLLISSQSELEKFMNDNPQDKVSASKPLAKKQKALRLRVKGHNDNVKKCIDKYAILHQKLIATYPNLPPPSQDALFNFDISDLNIKKSNKEKKKAKPAVQLLSKDIYYVKLIYQILNDIDPNISIESQLAHDQCVAFLGQLFKEINGRQSVILKEPTHSIWSADFGQTIQVRHRRLMHNVINYDAEVITNFVENSILPWEEYIETFSNLAEYHCMAEIEPKKLQEFLDDRNISILVKFYQNIGRAYFKLKQWENSEKHLLLAYDLCKDQTDDAPAFIMHHLADLYRAKGNWSKTTKWMEKCYFHRKTYKSSDNNELIKTLTHMGICYHETDDLDNAIHFLLLAYELSKYLKLPDRNICLQLANLYADQMCYKEAISLYLELLSTENDTLFKVHTLHSLQTTYMDSGQYELATSIQTERQNLFDKNKSYFKKTLDSDSYAELEAYKLKDALLLDAIGKSTEAYELLNTTQENLTFEHLYLKFMISRNIKKYDEAKVIGESLLNSKDSYELAKHQFCVKTIYSDVLLHIGETLQGESNLKELTQQAIDMHNENACALSVRQIKYAPFNLLSEYYLRNNKKDEAIHLLNIAMNMLDKDDTKFLNGETFVTVVRYFVVHLNDEAANVIVEHLAKYMPIIADHIGQPLTGVILDAILNLIHLLVKNNLIDYGILLLESLNIMYVKSDANKADGYLSAHISMINMLIKKSDLGKSEILFNHYMNANLDKCDKAMLSYVYTNLLRMNNHIDRVFDMVKNYHASWRDIIQDEPAYVHLSCISNLHFLCFKTKADNGDKKSALFFAQNGMRMISEMFSVLEREKPPHHLYFKSQLYKQYWRLSLAIYELLDVNIDVAKINTNSFYKLISNELKLSSLNSAEILSKVYFANELIIKKTKGNKASLSIPKHWQNFLSSFYSYLPQIIRLSIRGLELTMLDFQPPPVTLIPGTLFLPLANDPQAKASDQHHLQQKKK